MRPVTLLVCFVVIPTLVSAQFSGLVSSQNHSDSSCEHPTTFIKKLGAPLRADQVAGMCASSDGNIYLIGQQENTPMVAKITPDGEPLWVRNFPLAFPQQIAMAEIIEDSEGMLVFCGSQENMNNTKSSITMRYDPNLDTVLWYRYFGNEAVNILEREAGGNFILHKRQQIFSGNMVRSWVSIQELDRDGGLVILGSPYAQRLVGKPEIGIVDMVMDQDALYGAGFWQPGTVQPLLAKISLTDGKVDWAFTTNPLDSAIASPPVYEYNDLVRDNDQLVIASSGQQNQHDPGAGYYVYLEKRALDGSLLWLKRYDLSMIPEDVIALPDAYIIFGKMLDNNWAVLKTDKNGNPLQAKTINLAPAVPPVFTTYPYRHNQILRLGDHFFMIDHIQANGFSDIVLIKTDLDLQLDDSCNVLHQVQVNVLNLQANLEPLSLERTSMLTTSSVGGVILNPDSLPVYKVCPKCPCLTVPPPQPDTILLQFYPGDTIVLNGVPYTGSATVTQQFTTADDCDSIVTYILQQIITTLDVQCPANLSLTLPPGQTSMNVPYSLPLASTDCPDATVQTTLLQGPGPGGVFPVGTTTVCYELENQCGIRDTCCFTVSLQPFAQPADPCDVKMPPGCFQYELLDISLDSVGQRRYRIRLTNSCPSPLLWTCIQLPKGVQAVSPKEGAIYTAPAGNTYTVRNANASPFYSIRYKTFDGNLTNGGSDIFEYTLPQQSAPNYIHVAAKLADGSTSETHLNTFYCPVQPYHANKDADAANARSAEIAQSADWLAVRPNPSSGQIFVALGPWVEQTVSVRIINSQGQLVFDRRVMVEQEWLPLELPAALANGLYFLSVQPNHSSGASTRFVLKR